MVNTKSVSIFSTVIPRMLPHKMDSAVELIAVWGVRFKKINPKEIINEKMMPKMTLVGKCAFSANGPRITATPVDRIRAITSGSTDMTNPRAAPAKAAWDMANPREDKFMRTTKEPTNEQEIPVNPAPIIVKTSNCSIIVPP